MPSGATFALDPIDKVVRRMEDDDLLVNLQIWTKAEEGILKDSLQAYRETPSGEKGDFIKYKVVKRIKALEQKKHPDGALKAGGSMYKMWRKKKKRIYCYMMNHGSTPRGVKLPGLSRKFTYDSVLREFRRADILAEAKRLAGGVETTGTKWIGYYQQARVKVKDHLNDEEKAVIKETVIKWNMGYVPPEVQQRMAKRQSKKVLREMNRRLFLAMGMRSVTMECHLAEDGTMRYSLTDTEGLKLDDPRIPAFRTFDPDAVKNMEAAYKRYIKYIYDVLKDPDNPLPPPPVDVDPEVHLEYHPGGLPKVPDLVPNYRGTETNKIQQEFIRKYISKHHELALGRQIRFFYKPIGDNLSEFLAPGSWPPDIPFKETSRYDGAETFAILTHWRARQEAGEIPFKFNWLPIGNSSVPENYPKDIFKMAEDATRGAAAAAVPSRPKPVLPKYKKSTQSTLTGWDDTDTDSEARKSDQDDIPQTTDSVRDEDSVRASTPPDSQVDTESLAGDSTRAMSEVRPSSPLKRIFKQGARKGRGGKKTRGAGIGHQVLQPAAVTEEPGHGVTVSEGDGLVAAVAKKKTRAKETAPPPPPPQKRTLRSTRAIAAAPTKATSKKVPKGKK